MPESFIMGTMAESANERSRWDDLANELGLPPEERRPEPPPQSAPKAKTERHTPPPQPHVAPEPEELAPAPAAASVEAFGEGIYDEPTKEAVEEDLEPPPERPRRRRENVSVEQELREVL